MNFGFEIDFEPRADGQDVRVSLKIKYCRMELKVTARISTARRGACGPVLLCCRRSRRYAAFPDFSIVFAHFDFLAFPPSLSFAVRRTRTEQNTQLTRTGPERVKHMMGDRRHSHVTGRAGQTSGKLHDIAIDTALIGLGDYYDIVRLQDSF